MTQLEEIAVVKVIVPAKVGVVRVVVPGPQGARGLSGSGPYQEALTIEQQNVIPPLTMPWQSVAGAFANIIIGAATLVNGGGAVTFTNGSQEVAFNPTAAGFNLNPGDKVVAQYSTG